MLNSVKLVAAGNLVSGGLYSSHANSEPEQQPNNETRVQYVNQKTIDHPKKTNP